MDKFNTMYYKLLPVFTGILMIYWGFDLYQNLKIENSDRIKLDVIFFVIFTLGFVFSIYTLQKKK